MVAVVLDFQILSKPDEIGCGRQFVAPGEH